jgi:hypothetical protein
LKQATGSQSSPSLSGKETITLGCKRFFKNFYRLAEFETRKRKEMWLTDNTYVLKYLRSGSSIRSATHKHRDVWENLQRDYPTIKTVRDYYRLREDVVQFKLYAPDQRVT